MRVVLRKWTPRYKYKNFLTHFRLSLFPGCFGENLTNISQIFIPYKSALSGCIPPKIKCEILAHNGSQTLARQEITTPPETANQLGQRDLLASMTIDQDFPEKVTHCRHVFFCFVLFF